MKNKLLSAFLLALCIISAALVSARADKTVVLDDSKGRLTLMANSHFKFDNESENEYSGALILTQTAPEYSKGIIVEAGEHHIVLNGVKIVTGAGVSPIEQKSGYKLTLSLADGTNNYLSARATTLDTQSAAGLRVPEGAELVLQRQGGATGDNAGKLYATGGSNGAGIGGAGEASGAITITGGAIYVNGGSFGAGIGGGNGGAGTVTISDSSIYADGGEQAAGIGGGKGGAGTVTISNSTVTADGSYDGAGIGGGQRGMGTVTINSSTVTAFCYSNAAGIGGGRDGDGTVTIDGGTITATGGNYGAGIGGGDAGDGTVTIDGGTITATGGIDGAGIGGGYGGDGTVTINGGTIAATGKDGGAGIGGGEYCAGNVTINGSVGMVITAQGKCALGGLTRKSLINGSVVMTNVQLSNLSYSPAREMLSYGLEPHIEARYSATQNKIVVQPLSDVNGNEVTGIASGTGAVSIRALSAGQASAIAVGEGGIAIAGMDASTTGGTLGSVCFMVSKQAIADAGGPFQTVSVIHKSASGRTDKLSTLSPSNGDVTWCIADATGLGGSPFVLVGYRSAVVPPKTGDVATPLLWLLLCAACVGGGALLLRRRRRR